VALIAIYCLLLHFKTILRVIYELVQLLRRVAIEHVVAGVSLLGNAQQEYG